MVPAAIVLAAVGYGCWPYLDTQGPRAATQEAGKLPEITAALLSPTIAPAPARNPFGLAVATQTPATVAPSAAETDAEESTAETAEGSVAETREIDTKSLLSDLALNATFLTGNRRVAVINSQLYAEGEPLGQSASSKQPYVVAQIYQHKVLLERQGQTVELNYPDLVPKSDAAPRIPTANHPAPSVSRPTRPVAGHAPQPSGAKPLPPPKAPPRSPTPSVSPR